MQREQWSALGDWLAQSIRDTGHPPPAEVSHVLARRTEPVYVEFRRHGKWLHAESVASANQLLSVRDALDHCRISLGNEFQRTDAVILCLTYDFREVDMASDVQQKWLTANIHRGVLGLQLTRRNSDTAATIIAPTTTVATNRDFQKVLDGFRESNELDDSAYRRGDIRVCTFHADQLYVRLAGKPRAMQWFRGQRLIDVSEINRRTVEGIEQLLGDYLIRSVQPDGRMRYMYYPSRGSEDASLNNMIRQWMATLALCRTAFFRDDDRVYKIAARNIDYNLGQFYSELDHLGLIEYRGKIKLGAVALATLAIMEHDCRNEFRDVQRRLLATIQHLWRKTGEFRTFLQPTDRNDNQNFYPGEALLTWSYLYREIKDESLYDQFMTSFHYYRAWHLKKNRNPAFIPWHTQAYYIMWCETRDRQLQDFIFEMNDWLLEIQQWQNAPSPDCRGRFYDPKRPFGPPHASSTGVYLEGLADAFKLARDIGDQMRAERYRVAILRGLRSLMQLTFKDDDDMFYVQKRDLLSGGVRTTVYNNVVRVDNVQHNLMAVQKVLVCFRSDDFQHDDQD